jgi:catalase
MSNNKKIMTTNAGIPISDNQNSLTAGPRGPVLMQDFYLTEKMAQFNRERIPERVVHAKGAGAHGRFTATADISKFTKAKVFTKGKTTEMFARFSTVGGERGSADTVHDPRGFALKFYTEEGNWDMVGNNTPVFFLRDPLKFADFIHTQKRDPATNLKSPTMMWDYFSLSPESLHQVTILFSDRGIPKSFRHMHGFSSHTFSFINEVKDRFWVKFHFMTLQGIENLPPEEAIKIAGSDPDYLVRDLYNAIAQGDFPKWRVCVQIMPEAEAENYYVNPFDLTKVWRHKDYPLQEIGIMELNRNPKNYFAEVEQAAFAPSNVPPGISFSPDKVLQARVMTYSDAHRYRIGTNFDLLPINCPHATKANNYYRDGEMRFDDNGGAMPNYQPNSFHGPVDDHRYDEPPLKISGDAARYDHRIGNDEFTQAGDLFRLMSSEQQALLCTNIADSMRGIDPAIQQRQIALFMKVDKKYGEGVQQRL